MQVDEITFQLNGESIRLSRHQVIESVQREPPEPIQTWAVDIQGRLFPAKQVFALATGKGRTTFISHQARDLLQRLGFRVIDVKRERVDTESLRTGHVDQNHIQVHRGPGSVRVEALQLAIQFMGDRPNKQIGDLLQLAGELESWIGRSN